MLLEHQLGGLFINAGNRNRAIIRRPILYAIVQPETGRLAWPLNQFVRTNPRTGHKGREWIGQGATEERLYSCRFFQVEQEYRFKL